MHTRHLVSKVIVALIALMILIYIVKQPNQAADSATGIGDWLADAANGIGNFLHLIAG